jgi:hypothetical protein
MNEALTHSSQTVELPWQQVVVNPAFSDMLSGKITLLSGRVFSLWNSINQQILKVGHRMQVIQHSLASDGSALDVSDLP